MDERAAADDLRSFLSASASASLSTHVLGEVLADELISALSRTDDCT
jgi:hypothetical protein